MSEAPHIPGLNIPGLKPKAIPTERGKFVPSWYEPHTDPRLKLWTGTADERKPFVVNGVQVTIGMIPPENRWAVEADGRVRDQRDFEDLHKRAWVDHYVAAGATKIKGDENLRPVPRVEKFLSLMVDPTNSEKVIKIGANPNKPAPANAKKIVSDEPVVDVDKLSPQFKQAPEGVVPKKEEDTPLAMLEKAYKSGAIKKAEYENRVMEILNIKGKPRRARKPITMLCGKIVRGGTAVHEANCDKCQGIRKKGIEIGDPTFVTKEVSSGDA